MAFTDAVQSGIIDFVTKRGGVTTYLTLLSADIVPSDTMATMAEVTGGGLVRLAVAFSAPARDTGAATTDPQYSGNTADVTFGPLTANMATAANTLALVTALTGTTGTILRTWVLGTPWQGNTGDTLTVPAQSLKITAR